jgi:hypothetical protein
MELGVETAEKEVIQKSQRIAFLCSALLAIIGPIGVCVAFGSGVDELMTACIVSWRGHPLSPKEVDF